MVLDYNESNEGVGVEMRHLSKRSSRLNLSALEFETALAAEPPLHSGRERLKTRRYEPGALDTPAALQRCSEAGSVPAVTLMGNLGILNRRLIGFFCSVRCSGDVILNTYDLARMLRETDVMIVGSFQCEVRRPLAQSKLVFTLPDNAHPLELGAVLLSAEPSSTALPLKTISKMLFTIPIDFIRGKKYAHASKIQPSNY